MNVIELTRGRYWGNIFLVPFFLKVNMNGAMQNRFHSACLVMSLFKHQNRLDTFSGCVPLTLFQNKNITINCALFQIASYFFNA